MVTTDERVEACVEGQTEAHSGLHGDIFKFVVIDMINDVRVGYGFWFPSFDVDLGVCAREL
jgi:hypothetical protein